MAQSPLQHAENEYIIGVEMTKKIYKQPISAVYTDAGKITNVSLQSGTNI